MTGKHRVTQGAPALAGLTVGLRAELGIRWERGLLTSPVFGRPNCRGGLLTFESLLL